jgi:hypothetical protein
MRNAFELLVPLAVVVAVSSGPGCSNSSGNGTTGGNDSGADSSMGEDTGTADSGMQEDTGVVDTGTVDTSVIDANWKDTGSEDGGANDASDAAPFCGPISTLPSPIGGSDAGPALFGCPGASVDAGIAACNAGSEHCCENGVGDTASGSCVPVGTACSGSNITDWNCTDPATDCAGGTPVCCATGATLVVGGTGCGNYATGMTGTTCSATCTGITLCTSNAECPAGKTCTPFEYAGNPVGGCR